MSWIDDLPIRRKLTAIVMITCSVCMILACVVLAAYERLDSRANAERDALMGASESMDDFLRGLDMTAVHDHSRASIIHASSSSSTRPINSTPRRVATPPTRSRGS